MKVERHSKYLVDSSSSVSYGKSNVHLSSFTYNILNLQYLSVAVKKDPQCHTKMFGRTNRCTAKAAVKRNGIYQSADLESILCRAFLLPPQKCFFDIRVAITTESLNLPA